MPKFKFFIVVVACAALSLTAGAVSVPVRAQKGMVASQNDIASRIGADVIKEGGTAVDAAVATAFALAVVHPHAGNIGGGGFMVYRPASGEAVAYDFREMAPAKSSPTMFLENGQYSSEKHHNSYLAVGVPGTVAGLHMAWKEQGKLPWKRLVEPAIGLARDGFTVTDGLSRSRKSVMRQMQNARRRWRSSPGTASHANGRYAEAPGAHARADRESGPAGFYEGETALALEEMLAHGGLITRDDLKKCGEETGAGQRRIAADVIVRRSGSGRVGLIRC
jgi:gamma-glutamyltranspeptidase/glutathione hydrolase